MVRKVPWLPGWPLALPRLLALPRRLALPGGLALGLALALGLLGQARLGLLEAVDRLRRVAVELLRGSLLLLGLGCLLEGLLGARGVALVEGVGRLLERLRELGVAGSRLGSR